MRPFELTAEEQENVRRALRFLRHGTGTWGPLVKLLGFQRPTLSKMVACGGRVSANVAFRVSRLARVTMEDVLTGRYPAEGLCPFCGQVKP